MPQYIDSYYLVDNRNYEVVHNFLIKYARIREEVADNYPFPEFSDSPQKIYSSINELLLYLEGSPNYDYAIYWEIKDIESKIKQFTLQYTDDGKMIFGVSIVGNEPDSMESIKLFIEIKNYLNSKYGCITIEEPPPTNSLEFIDFCNERYIPID